MSAEHAWTTSTLIESLRSFMFCVPDRAAIPVEHGHGPEQPFPSRRRRRRGGDMGTSGVAAPSRPLVDRTTFFRMPLKALFLDFDGSEGAKLQTCGAGWVGGQGRGEGAARVPRALMPRWCDATRHTPHALRETLAH